MKASLSALALTLTLTLLVLVLSLGACASMDERNARIAFEGKPLTEGQAYMSEVERVARRRGLEVIWVNPPKTTDQVAVSP